MIAIEERPNQSQERRRIEYTMSSLEVVANHVPGIPGRNTDLDDERRYVSK